MKWVTEIDAIDPVDGKMKKWHGPVVPGNTEAEAKEYCESHGLGYCSVSGEFVEESEWEENIKAFKRKMNEL